MDSSTTMTMLRLCAPRSHSPLFDSIRQILNFNGIPFSDQRAEPKEVPFLEWEGGRINGGRKILRFVGRNCQLGGLTETEAARADELCGFVCDVITEMRPFDRLRLSQSASDEKKEVSFRENFLPTCGYFLPILSTALKQSGSGYLLRSGLSYVDFLAASRLRDIAAVDSKLFSEYPDLLAFAYRVGALPDVAECLRRCGF